MLKKVFLISLLTMCVTTPFLSMQNNETIQKIDNKNIYNRDYSNILIYTANGIDNNNTKYTYDLYINNLSYGLIYNQSYSESLLYYNYSLILGTRVGTSDYTYTNLGLIDNWDYATSILLDYSKVEYIIRNYTAISFNMSNTSTNSPSNLTDTYLQQSLKVSMYVDGNNYIDLIGNNSRSIQLNINGFALTNVTSNSYDFKDVTQVQDLRKDVTSFEYDNGYNNGYNDGYNIGETDGYNKGVNVDKDLFSLIGSAFNGLTDFFAIELLPGLPLGLLLFAPIFIGVVLLLLKLVVK